MDRQNHGFLRGEGKIGEDKIKKIQNSMGEGYAARGYLASQLEEPPTLGPPSKWARSAPSSHAFFRKNVNASTGRDLSISFIH